QFTTLPIENVLDRHYPVLRFVAQVWQDGYLSPLRSNMVGGTKADLVVTMDELLRRTPFADRMRRMLQTLEKEYASPVDMEFTLKIENPNTTTPDVRISILQCRPQSHLIDTHVSIPSNLPEKDIVFSTSRVLPHGEVSGIKYVLFVTPEGYYGLPTPAARVELGRAIGRLNKALADEVFFSIGPGRWGTSNPDLGVRIGYADIYNARALIELSGKGIGSAPEPSFGTHFFQDLIESKIFPLAIFLDDKDTIFNREFFYNTPNHLLEFLPDDEDLLDTLQLIKVSDYRDNCCLELIMDEEASRAVAFFKQIETPMENL
ncbi:MAG: PEP/pyruvate-binding domain-containing protein, partial [Chloroflexota bacterium]